MFLSDKTVFQKQINFKDIYNINEIKNSFILNNNKSTYLFLLEKAQIWNFDMLIKLNCIMIHFHVLMRVVKIYHLNDQSWQ